MIDAAPSHRAYILKSGSVPLNGCNGMPWFFEQMHAAFAILAATALAVLAIGGCAVTLLVVLCSSMSAIYTRSSFSALH